MRLGITSDCIHFKTPSGAVATDTHIFLRQIEALAGYFESVTICCPFIEMPQGLSYSVYQNKKISFMPSPAVGGKNFGDKIKLLQTIPAWLRLFRQLDRSSDIVYQRFPNNLNIPGFFYFYFKRKKVFATFTGSWDKDPVASFSTRFQKFLLQHFFKGPVWVYTNEKKLKANIFSGFSPSYSVKEWEEEGKNAEKKIVDLLQRNQRELRMVSAGTLCDRKNHLFILKTCVMLKSEEIPFSLAIAGAGERMEEYKTFIAENGLSDSVELKGSMHYNDLRQLYRECDYVVQSPISEGYGKVPIEGYFHGLIPILSSASILAQYITDNGNRGFVFDLADKDSLFNVLKYVYEGLSAERKIEMIRDGRSFVKTLTIDEWAYNYITEIRKYYPSIVQDN